MITKGKRDLYMHRIPYKFCMHSIYCVRLFFIYPRAAALSSVFCLLLSLGRQVGDSFSLPLLFILRDPSDPDTSNGGERGVSIKEN